MHAFKMVKTQIFRRYVKKISADRYILLIEVDDFQRFISKIKYKMQTKIQCTLFD